MTKSSKSIFVGFRFPFFQDRLLVENEIDDGSFDRIWFETSDLKIIEDADEALAFQLEHNASANAEQVAEHRLSSNENQKSHNLKSSKNYSRKCAFPPSSIVQFDMLPGNCEYNDGSQAEEVRQGTVITSTANGDFVLVDVGKEVLILTHEEQKPEDGPLGVFSSTWFPACELAIIKEGSFHDHLPPHSSGFVHHIISIIDSTQENATPKAFLADASKTKIRSLARSF